MFKQEPAVTGGGRWRATAGEEVSVMEDDGKGLIYNEKRPL